ncbi:MAG: hypothetical protein SFT68_00625 [Rickettsiaceae bacterium]|nr:hypothetical protein [Rickettsiaceae bacterium]
MDVLNNSPNIFVPYKDTHDQNINNATPQNNLKKNSFEVKVKNNLNNYTKSVTQTNQLQEINKTNGTKIAGKIEKLSKLSQELEVYIMANMWKVAYSASKFEENNDISEILYGDQFIDAFVSSVYQEPGPLASTIMQKLIDEYKVILENKSNETERN